MTDIKPASGQLIISEDLMSVATYQAIYYKLTKKTETLSKIYEETYIIGRDDLVNLNNFIEQATVQYSRITKSCEVSVSVKEGQGYDYSSFEKFRMQNFTTLCPTKSINYKYDFLARLPTEHEETSEIPQRYIVNISMDQDFVEDPSSGPIRMLYRSLYTGQNLGFRIEYTDYSVALSIQASIDEWVKSLRKTQVSRWVSIIVELDDIIRALLPKILTVGFLVFCAGLDRAAHTLTNTSAERYLILCAAATVLVNSVGIMAANRLMFRFQRLRPLTFIQLTSGDITRKHKFDSDNNKRATEFLFILTSFVAIPVGILANYLSKMVGI